MDEPQVTSSIEGSTHYHQLGGFGGDPAIFGRRLGAHLPWRIHLVAKTPELDAMGRRMAVRMAQVAQRRACGKIAVFDQVARRIRPARSEIHDQHRLNLGRAAPVDELVGAKTIGLDAAPREVEASRPAGERPDAIFPIVAGDEITAGIAHDRGAKLAHELNDVAAETARIRAGVPRLEDPAIDAAAEMLDKGAEQAAVDGADLEIPVQYDFGAQHLSLPETFADHR